MRCVQQAARAPVDWVERAAVGASILCLIHCAGLPDPGRAAGAVQADRPARAIPSVGPALRGARIGLGAGAGDMAASRLATAGRRRRRPCPACGRGAPPGRRPLRRARHDGGQPVPRPRACRELAAAPSPPPA